jgi:protein gp37
MTDLKRIEKGMYWDRAWSLVAGCSYVSPGCANCWSAAETHMRSGQQNPKIRERYQGLTDERGKWNGKVRLMEKNLELPLKVKKPTVWAVWNDLHHEDVPMWFQDEAYTVMAKAKHHIFLVLTKRIDLMKKYMDGCQRGAGEIGGRFPWPNVGLGVTAEDQPRADERIPLLLETPAAWRFVSYEPALGPIDVSPWIRRYYHGGPPGIKDKLLPPSITGYSTLLKYSKEIAPDGDQRADRVYFTTDPQMAEIFTLGTPGGMVYQAIPDLPIEPDPDCLEPGLSYQAPSASIVPLDTPTLDWVIAGGESGPGARPCHPDWIRAVRDQCKGAGVPFFFKQWGEWAEYPYTFSGKRPERASQLLKEYIVADTTNKSNIGKETQKAYDHEGNPTHLRRVGKKAAGRLLDGREWSQMPDVMRR